jgi:GTPase SAR1 family protein
MARSINKERIARLEEHLKQENPVLADAVNSFRKLDRVAHGLGILDKEDSYATQVSWWPVISILGTFSSGKSTFLNQYIGRPLQRTGNQAVDDKFTVICYGSENADTVLPGLALDSDPRFPFYQISRAIEKVAEGEGRRVDSYLQLKTSRADSLRGKIFIDSPGFDADQQRTSTLVITDHIMDLSDLVLVFFDARHPEPGAMRDTLKHLVGDTVTRSDATKFLYILNQIDNTAREDNPEDVVAAWQRALAQSGLTAGRFYRIFARDVAVAIEDDQVRERLERKRDEDQADIEARIRQVEVERAYRVVGVLEKTARRIQETLVPEIATARRLWRRRTLWLDGIVFGGLLALFLVVTIGGDHWQGMRLAPFAELGTPWQILVAALVIIGGGYLHGRLRRLAGRTVLRTLRQKRSERDRTDPVARAFEHNLRAWWRSSASPRPRGWSRRARRRLEQVFADADDFIQVLNDRYASPSGDGGAGQQSRDPGVSSGS